MICLHCQFDNPASMKFCVECGTGLQIVCTGCQSLMMPSYKFCGECGRTLQDQALQDGAQATAGATPTRLTPVTQPASKILPADTARPSQPPSAVSAAATATVSSDGERKQVTVLFCELATRSGAPPSADVLHEQLTTFFELAQESVEKYGGTINRHLNQGIMALFGAPVAYEDHPRRALLAALAIRGRIDAVDSEEWTARMGVDTGSVVVGGVGGMAVGEATEIADQLSKLAEPGEILVSDTAARMTQSQVLLEEHGTLGDQELAVWQAQGEIELGGYASYSSPFVGRERELSVLEQLRDQAQAGYGQVIALNGEAGSGKSRLMHELYSRTFPGNESVSYIRGQCISYGTGIPYLPLAGMIRKASRISEGDSHEVVREKLRQSLEAVGTDPEETMPFLLRLLGVEEGTEALADLEPLAIQARTFSAMRRMILDAAQHALVVVEIEDLQWIDATSAEFLDSLIEAMAAARLFVVLSYRSGYQPNWLDKSYATQLKMGRLSDQDCRKLLANLLPDESVADKLSDDILTKAEGNPFFLEEMARSLTDGSGQESVPETVQGVLMARIDRLPEDHKQLLRTGSILGRELSMELLEQIWDRPVDLDPLLEDLQRWELLYKAPSEDRVTYYFRQALTQEVTYQSLLAPRRQEYHRKTAQALERMYEGRLEDAFDRLIYHYPKAGEPKKTVYYLTLFARKAAEGYAHSEAAAALREALEQAEALEASERDRQSIEILLQLADSLLPLASFPETLQLFQKHLERLESLDDPSLAGRYYFWLAHTYTYMGFQEETRDFADKSIEAARAAEDETTEGKARYVLGRDGFWSGQFNSGIENSLRAVVLLERNGEPWWQGQAYWVAGFNHYVLGQFEQAIDALERALAIGEALDDYRLDTSWSLGYFYASLGESDTGIEQCQKGLERSRDPLNSAVSAGFLGHAILQKGEDLEGAVEHLTRATEMMGQAGMQQLEGWFCAFLGEALLAQGQFDRAAQVAERGLNASKESKFLYGIGLCQEALGRIEFERKSPEKALQWLNTARKSFVELQVPFEIARLDLEIGRTAKLSGDPEAPTVLARAEAAFEAMHVPYWIERTREAISS